MMWRLAFLLLTRPRAGIRQAIGAPPSLNAQLVFLGVIGCWRGVLEAAWLYGMARRQGVLLERLLAETGRFLYEGALFVAANVMTAYLRWAIYAILLLGVARWFGRRVPFERVSVLAAMILGLYVVPVLVNGIYLVAPLPSIRFAVSAVYQPVIGLGQVVATIWFAWVTYHIFRQACSLSVLPAALGAVFIPLLDRVLFVGAAALVFRVRALAWLPVPSRMGVVTVGFLLVALIATPTLLWLGRRWGTRPEGRVA